MNKIDPQKLLEVAKSAAEEAGAFILDHVQKEVVINEESHHDLKIQLDVDTQALLTEHILSAFPEHTILGEEGGQGSGGKGYEWIIDPLDGTVNLAYGIPHYCTSVACQLDGVVQAGVVLDPNRRETFYASVGGGAWVNGRKISVSKRDKVEQAIMALGFSKNQDSIVKCLEMYQHYGPKARKLRAMGSAALDMVYIASGRLDVYIEQGIKIWDIAAGKVILEEAGGKVILTPRPEPHHYHICASNGRLTLDMQ